MKNKFELLRAAIRERYMNMADVAERIGRSLSYVTQRMSGMRQWELSDIYALMALLDIPEYQMPAYFTKDGARPAPGSVRPPLTARQGEIIAAYEQAKEMQPAVDVLLGISG